MKEISYTLKSNKRADIRKELVDLFLQEESGLEFRENDLIVDPKKYKYNVESVSDSDNQYTIYLQRPAPLNKGFDFIVKVEGFYFKTDGNRHRNPSHEDILHILTRYKNKNEEYYSYINDLILKTFYCENINFTTQTQQMPKFINFDGEEIPVAVILYCIKWLFIEQDIIYWNYSGRCMLFNSLKDNNLVWYSNGKN